VEEDVLNMNKMLFKYCLPIFSERFFDILNQNDEIFKIESTINTEFLPGISFKYIWNCDISDNTRKTIWKYLQMISISLKPTINSETFDEEEIKDKINEIIENVKTIFTDVPPPPPSSSPTTDSTLPPSASLDGINQFFEGKFGNLVKELAQEVEQDINVENMNSVGDIDIVKTLFSDPSKVMNMVQTLGKKLDTKMKSGDISESDILNETSTILNSLKNVPGMGMGMNNIQSMLNMMGGGGGGPSRQQRNLPKKTHVRPTTNTTTSSKPLMTDEELIAEFSGPSQPAQKPVKKPLKNR
jgi:hypothetical protein